MDANTSKEIRKIVSNAKIHRDTFAIKALAELLKSELDALGDEDRNPEAMVVKFMDEAVKAIEDSPIYSNALVRALYSNVLDVTANLGVPRESLLEDLLFQSLLRPTEPDKKKRSRHKDAGPRILEAALAEFSEKGFHSATIDSIAERAGIAKGTVYRHFKTKEALFNALKENMISEFVSFVKEEIQREEDVLAVIESVIRNYLTFFENNSAFFKVLVQEQKDFGREVSDKFIQELILALPGLKRRCWKASRAGHLRQMNYFTAFYGIIGFLNGVIQKWLHEGGEGSLIAETEAVKEVVFYGIASPDVRKESRQPFKVIS